MEGWGLPGGGAYFFLAGFLAAAGFFAPAAGFLALFAAGLKRNQTADMGGSVILAEQGCSRKVSSD